MSYSTFRGFLREQFPNLKLDSVTPAKHNAASNSTTIPHPVTATNQNDAIKIEENLNSLS